MGNIGKRKNHCPLLSCRKPPSPKQIKPQSKTSLWQHTAIASLSDSVRFCPQGYAVKLRLSISSVERGASVMSKTWECLKPSDLKRGEIRERNGKTWKDHPCHIMSVKATRGNRGQCMQCLCNVCSKMFEDRSNS